MDASALCTCGTVAVLVLPYQPSSVAQVISELTIDRQQAEAGLTWTRCRAAYLTVLAYHDITSIFRLDRLSSAAPKGQRHNQREREA